MKTKLNNQKGFTIIEVLIVLAIAGLILLIVFLAVPALQRNSRNTQRRNEVAGILGGVNEFANNNNGKLPTAGAQETEALTNSKINFYSGAVTWVSGGVANTTTDTTVVIVKAAKCGNVAPNTTNSDAVGGSARQFVALFTVESGDGTGTKQCQES